MEQPSQEEIDIAFPPPPPVSLREEFHKFSIFMAHAVEAGDNTYKDVEEAICNWFITKHNESIQRLIDAQVDEEPGSQEEVRTQIDLWKACEVNRKIGMNQSRATFRAQLHRELI